MSLLPPKVKNTTGDVTHLFAPEPANNNLLGPVMLIDPAAGCFDYRAGVVEGRAFEWLLAMHTQGRAVQVRKRLNPLAWCGEHPVALYLGLCAIVGSVITTGMIAATTTGPFTMALFAAVVTSVVAGPLVAWLIAERANKRIDLLYRALGPQLRDLRLGTTLTSGVCDLRGGLYGLVTDSHASDGVMKAGIYEASLMLYAAARAIDERSPELEAAVVDRIAALVDRVSDLRHEITPEVVAPAIEAPAPTRSVAELTRELSGFAEPETVEYEANPAITAYPHAKDPR